MKYWYEKKIKNILSQEDGVTLVELLAAILLLSIIVTSFMSFFIQAAKTNNQTDDVNQATFIAQEQMELMTLYSQTMSANEATSLIAESPKNIQGFVIYSDLSKAPEDTLYTGIVKVSKGEKVYAQMETRLSFE